MNPKRLSQLIDAHLEGKLTSIEADELSRAMFVEPEVRRLFWEHTALHGLIQEATRLEWLGTASAEVENKVVRVAWWRWAAPLAAAAAVVLLAVAWWQRTPRAQGLTNGVAVLTRVVGVEWADPNASRAAGAVLTPGSLRLKSGAVQVEFYSGARVVVEGPAEFRLVSSREGFLQAGRLTAHVPPQAHGFKIGSAALTVVDQGTDFGVAVSDAATEEVHVFAGKVEVVLNARNATMRPLVTGEAARLETGALRSIPATPASFLGEAELACRDAAEAQRRYAAWREASRALGADPATLVHFTYEDQGSWDRLLTNHADRGSAATHGNIIGCRWAEGRWPGKRALTFSGEGDRVRFEVTAPMPTVTFLAWLRVDGLPHSTHALCAAETEQPGALRWQLTRQGALRLGVARPSSGPEANWEAVNSPAVITPERLGQWLMVASVFDGKRISHYANGQLVAAVKAEGPSPFTLSTVELGNWGVTPDLPNFQWAAKRGPDYFLRGFQGRIDEFAILARALSAAEVLNQFQNGQINLGAAESGNGRTVASHTTAREPTTNPRQK